MISSRKYLLKSVLFAVPILFLWSWMEFKLSNIPNSYSEKSRILHENIQNIDFIALGSSQALYSVNPECFHLKGLNLANVSQSYSFDWFLLNEILNKKNKISFLFLPVSYFSFGYDLADSPEIWRIYFYYHYFQLHSPEIDHWDSRCYSEVMRYGFKTALTSSIQSKSNDLIAQMNVYGWIARHSSVPNTLISEESGKKRVELHHSLLNYSNRKKNIQYLENIFNLCNQHHVKVILFEPPVWKTYQKFQKAEIEESNDSLINYLKGKYSFHFIPASEFQSLELSDFYDNDHVNPSGARKISFKLSNLADSLLTVKNRYFAK